MALCHKRSIEHIENLFDKLAEMGTGRALEVAAGDGQVSMDLLQHYFEDIDCFDRCPVAVQKLEELQERLF